MSRWFWFATLTFALGGWACTARSAAAPPTGPATTAAPTPPPERLRVRVLHVYPHDRGAFTQGLEFFDGALYESTGLVGRSSVRRVDLSSGEVEQSTPVPGIFSEGLTRVGGRLIQLSWRDGRALVWRLSSLTKEREFTYQGEGWGLCFDGKRLIMSDGSAQLVFRDPENFQVVGRVTVTLNQRELTALNELECVGDVVYANVWQDTHIARIDPTTGRVTGWIDAAGLLSESERASTDVLNGIAYLPARGHFLLTGKLWPQSFEVDFVPDAQP